MSNMQLKMAALKASGGAGIDLNTVLRSPDGGGTGPLIGPGVEQRAKNG